MENISDLRKMLFETIRDVKDGKMPLDKAKAIQDVAQVLVNSAKVEVEFIKATGQKATTGFIPSLQVSGSHSAAPKQIEDSGLGYTGKLNKSGR